MIASIALSALTSWLAATPVAQVTTLDGKVVPFAQYERKVTVVFLWGSFCTDPKRLDEISALARAYQADKDVAFVAVDEDIVKKPDDLSVLKELARPEKQAMPVVVDHRFDVAAITQRLPLDGRQPKQLRVGLFVLRDGKPFEGKATAVTAEDEQAYYRALIAEAKAAK